MRVEASMVGVERAGRGVGKREGNVKRKRK